MKRKIALHLFLFSIFLTLSASSVAFADTWEVVIPSDGKSSRARLKIANQVVELWKKRFKTARRSVELKKLSPTRVSVEFGRKVDKSFVRNVLTTPGNLEIRELVDDVEVFEAFNKLKFKKETNKGIASICFKERKEVDSALGALIGPDFRFGVFRKDPQEKASHPWCVSALGAKTLRNVDIEKIEKRRSLKGDYSLLLKMKTKSFARLAENGELTVKSYAITIDGDIVARATLQQMKRLPISIRPPSWADEKEWVKMIRVLVLQPILVPVVLLEPK